MYSAIKTILENAKGRIYFETLSGYPYSPTISITGSYLTIGRVANAVEGTDDYITIEAYRVTPSGVETSVDGKLQANPNVSYSGSNRPLKIIYFNDVALI